MNLADKRVAVTGATGFIGRYIVRALRLRGAEVVAVVRKPEKLPALAQLGIETHRAELGNRESLRSGFMGADAVIGCAGLVSARARRSALITANTNGTRNVVMAAAAAGVGRVVHISSTAVYRPVAGRVLTEDATRRDEDDPRRPWTKYGVSKALGEAEAWRLARSLRVDLSTARPALVYGAFDHRTTVFWLKRLMAAPIGIWPAFTRVPLVYAGDVAEAVCRMLETPEASGRAYNLARSEDETLFDLHRAWRREGGPSPVVTLPVPLPVRREYSVERARRELAWENRSLADGVRETIALEQEARTSPTAGV